ncbi:MAG: hypothetical protein KJ626_00085 [Verrucomicrobia bacterium]|nr:hypothetical protein [Verrucomicrobiota bacterium]
MTESVFTITADGIDTAQIVADIQSRVAKKMEDGVYDDARIAKAEKTNLVNLRNEEQFLGFYLKCLRDAAYVDISDFEIRERRQGFGFLLVALKKVIWKLLKFYTYRLWSQQNQVNGLIVTAIDGVDEKYRGKIEDLEKRIGELEGRSQKSEGRSQKPVVRDQKDAQD